MIIGGDVVQVAIAQLCGGPVRIFTPVVFSFGWVTYAVQAMLSAVGENRLMPKPEIDCCIINAKSHYRRTNCSWVLSRILRDFEYWRKEKPDGIEAKLWREISPDAIEAKKLEELKTDPVNIGKDVRIGLRVTVWECRDASGHSHGDPIYWAGFGVAAIQLGIAAIPWGLYGEWLIFLIVGAGTLLAFFSGALPQWHKEKFGVRNVEGRKDVFLTQGNGDHDALLILGNDKGIDLEALASPYRELEGFSLTRTLSLLLATLWILLLLTIAGYPQHTWFMMAAGILGILHNVAVAGLPRKPRAFGIDLIYRATIVDRKVMGVLWQVEKDYPKAGKALIQEFFPGDLWPREELLWKYADRRNEAYKTAKKAYDRAARQGPPVPVYWQGMPPLERAEELRDDNTDIPASGEYKENEGTMNGQLNADGQQVAAGGSAHRIV
jgi:hypothetical protein